MKKILFLFLLLGMVGCEKQQVVVKKPIELAIEVHYLDNTEDTIYVQYHHDYEPRITTHDGISTLVVDFDTAASYVKSFRILK